MRQFNKVAQSVMIHSCSSHSLMLKDHTARVTAYVARRLCLGAAALLTVHRCHTSFAQAKRMTRMYVVGGARGAHLEMGETKL